jgi:glutathione S-transferase
MTDDAKMTLYSSATSPFARKVRVVACELGIEERIREVPVDPFDPPQELLDANPLGKVPTLVTETGLMLPDSRLIVSYLQSRTHAHGRGLAPLPPGNRRWRAMRRIELAEGVVECTAAIGFEKRRPESIVYVHFIDRRTAMIERTLAQLEADAADEPLALGKPSLAEITLACALGCIDHQMPYLLWRNSCPVLKDWLRAFAQRPSMLATQPSA